MSMPWWRHRGGRPCEPIAHWLRLDDQRKGTGVIRMSYTGKTIAHGGRELIAFRIGDQEFTVNIMSVREIRGWTSATPMPRSPAYMKGVINLRGAVLPIIDLSHRLGMKPAEPTPRHVIIVAQVGEKAVGLLVDAVSDILTVTDDNIQPTPEIASDLE